MHRVVRDFVAALLCMISTLASAHPSPASVDPKEAQIAPSEKVNEVRPLRTLAQDLAAVNFRIGQVLADLKGVDALLGNATIIGSQRASLEERKRSLTVELKELYQKRDSLKSAKKG